MAITVLEIFNIAQRNCTKQATYVAEVKVLRIINESTLASLAYRFGQKYEENKEEKGKIILVLHLYGRTFYVTLLKILKK